MFVLLSPSSASYWRSWAFFALSAQEKRFILIFPESVKSGLDKISTWLPLHCVRKMKCVGRVAVRWFYYWQIQHCGRISCCYDCNQMLGGLSQCRCCATA